MAKIDPVRLASFVPQRNTAVKAGRWRDVSRLRERGRGERRENGYGK